MQQKTINKSKASRGSSTPVLGVSCSSFVQIPVAGVGARISDLSKKIGSRGDAAKMIGVSAPQLHRYIREESSAPFDVMARLCAAAGVSMEWLVTGQEQAFSPAIAAHPKDLCTETLKVAVRMVERTLQATNRRMTPDQMAEAVLLVLDLLRSGLPEAEVLPLTRRAIGLAQITV